MKRDVAAGDESYASGTLGGQTQCELFKHVTNGFHSVINHFVRGGGGLAACLCSGSALFGPNWTETTHIKTPRLFYLQGR